ncbi:MAG: Rieske (2Fe-2S) protein [Alphaproteobacteria bacterium]
MYLSIPITDVAPGRPAVVAAGEQDEVAVFQVGEAYYATDRRCPHRHAPLDQGTVEGTVLICPLHHFKFNLETGRCLMPKHIRVRLHPVTRQGDRLVVEVPDPKPVAVATETP